MEGGSELDPIDVAVGAALGGDDVGSEVGPIKEPPGTEDSGEVEDREVISGGKRRWLGCWNGGGGRTSLSGHHYAKNADWGCGKEMVAVRGQEGMCSEILWGRAHNLTN